MSRSSVEFFLSQSIDKLRGGTFLRFTKSLLPKKFLDKRAGERTEGLSTFSVKLFCLTLPEIFAGNPSVNH